MINMMPREHHYTFTHRLLPGQLFKAPDRILGELTGPMGGTFLFFLWEEIGKVVPEKIKAVDTGVLPGSNQRMQVLKLDVVGTTRQGNKTLVILSMPPTEFPGEAMFVAVAYDGAQPRYFAYERNTGIASLGDHPDSAYLAELKPDQTRISLGAKPGTDASSFTRAVCAVLGMTCDQALQVAPDPVTAGVFAGAAGGAGAKGGRLAGIGGVLSALLIAMLAWPVVMRVLGGVFYRILGATVMNGLHGLLSLAMGITLLIWVYQLFAGLKGKGGWSPAMSVAGWLIPFANLVLPPLILRSGWRAVSNNTGGLLPLLWWPLHLGSTAAMIFWQVFPALISPQLSETGLDADILSTVVTLLSWLTFFVDVAAYGLFFHIVRTITKRA